MDPAKAAQPPVTQLALDSATLVPNINTGASTRPAIPPDSAERSREGPGALRDGQPVATADDEQGPGRLLRVLGSNSAATRQQRRHWRTPWSSARRPTTMDVCFTVDRAEPMTRQERNPCTSRWSAPLFDDDTHQATSGRRLGAMTLASPSIYTEKSVLVDWPHDYGEGTHIHRGEEHG